MCQNSQKEIKIVKVAPASWVAREFDLEKKTQRDPSQRGSAARGMVPSVLSRIFTAIDGAIRPRQTETSLATVVFGIGIRGLDECGLLFSSSTLCGWSPK